MACCTDANACVYSNVCYSNNEVTPNGIWICQSGTWFRLGINVYVNATPPSATTVWQNTDATASVYCTTPSPAIQCDPASYRLITYTTNPGTCPTTYSSYTLASPQTISSHSWVCGAAKDTLGTEGFSTPVEFRVDKISPTASLQPLPAWTNQSSVIISWSGSDTGGSGIDYFDLQYRITTITGSQLQDWTDWTTSVSNPGSLPFSGMQNNRTYYFRARARDNAGNIGSWSAVRSISVDLNPPTCQVTDLPRWTTSSSFIVSWSGSDGESGISMYDIQVKVGAAGTWGYLNNPDGYHTTETWDNVNGADGNTYFFRCRSYDVAGNMGSWSAEKNTTVDATPPVSSVNSLPPWLNVTSFPVSWSGSDGVSGVDCFDIQWSDDSVWNSWFSCTTSVSGTFGPASPASVTENVTYSFRSRAKDRAGNWETYPAQPDAYTTIDLTVPVYDIRAFDSGGNEISGYVANLDNVTLRSNATDYISGVLHNYIEYIMLDENGESYGSSDCGPAAPYGGISACSLNIDFTGGIMLTYWVRVIDRAGNMVVSSTHQIGTHPIANFVKHRVYMVLGESSRSKVQVRNIQDSADNVTVNISGNLPVPPYFVWVSDPDIEITGNNRTLVVKNLNPNEERLFFVMLWSSDEASTYQIDLQAFSALNLNLSDTDQATIQIGYPASFPGLNEWAIAILIVLAVISYFWIEKKQNVK
jgi:hypothetical protein